jgi:hypothetical protein
LVYIGKDAVGYNNVLSNLKIKHANVYKISTVLKGELKALTAATEPAYTNVADFTHR